MVELLSPGTEQEDLGYAERDIDQPPGKWEVYEQILRIPYYVVFSRYANRLQVFGLAGSRYQERPLMEGKIWLSEPGLGLGVWSGAYQGLGYQSGTPSGRTPGGPVAKAGCRTGRLNSVFYALSPDPLLQASEVFFGLSERIPALSNSAASPYLRRRRRLKPAASGHSWYNLTLLCSSTTTNLKRSLARFWRLKRKP